MATEEVVKWKKMQNYQSLGRESGRPTKRWNDSVKKDSVKGLKGEDVKDWKGT